jgi:endonuclease/exonuclease/phosphatase family metal-dependent hydrolase
MLARFYFCWLIFAVLAWGATLATYNVENLFDAKVEGSEYTGFTPGKFGWNEAMAQKKFDHTARAIKAIDADIIGLQEIENRALAVALANALDYPYVAFTKPLGSPTGVGLLSRYPIAKQQVLPSSLSKTRDMLHVTLVLDTYALDVVVVHWPSLKNPMRQREVVAKQLKTYVASLDEVVVLGDFNDPLGPKSALAQTFARLETLQGWFDPFFTQKERWSHDFFGKKEALDRILLHERFFDGKGLEYMPESFTRITVPFLATSSGSPYRWERKNRGKGAHTGKGYSDHFPLKLTLTSAPYRSNAKKTDIATLFALNEGSVNLWLEAAQVIYVHKEGFVLAQKKRRIYVYNSGFKPKLGEILDVEVHEIGSFQGMREIMALHVRKIHPETRDIAPHLLPPDALENANAGDVMREVKGVMKKGRLITPHGAIRVYSKTKSLLPNEGESVHLERVRVGMYGGQKELIIEERE